MKKGITSGLAVLITIILAFVVAAIFFYHQGYTKSTSENYLNLTNNTSVGGITVQNILGLFKKYRGGADFYCANSIQGMLVKDYCGCHSSGCEKDYIYSEDDDCRDAYGGYGYWRDENTYVAVCLEGDGCCDMPEPQNGRKVGQCLLVDLTKFNGKPIPLDGLMFRVDADSYKHCNNDLYVYTKFEGNNRWKVTAKKLDGSGDSGLEGIYLGSSYFPKNVSEVAICPNPDNWFGKCNHKIDWVKFKTSEKPKFEVCPSGEWSPEVLLKSWSWNSGIHTKNYTVRESFTCNIPGATDGWCKISKIERSQKVKDQTDYWKNEGLFQYNIDNNRYEFEKSCIDGASSDDWSIYDNSLLTPVFTFKKGEGMPIVSNYWELTGGASGCTSKYWSGGCYKKEMIRKCCPNAITWHKYMCASDSYDFGDWSLKVYGRYCCPSGMYWNTTTNQCES